MSVPQTTYFDLFWPLISICFQRSCVLLVYSWTSLIPRGPCVPPTQQSRDRFDLWRSSSSYFILFLLSILLLHLPLKHPPLFQENDEDWWAQWQKLLRLKLKSVWRPAAIWQTQPADIHHKYLYCKRVHWHTKALRILLVKRFWRD